MCVLASAHALTQPRAAFYCSFLSSRVPTRGIREMERSDGSMRSQLWWIDLRLSLGWIPSTAARRRYARLEVGGSVDLPCLCIQGAEQLYGEEDVAPTLGVVGEKLASLEGAYGKDYWRNGGKLAVNEGKLWWMIVMEGPSIPIREQHDDDQNPHSPYPITVHRSAMCIKLYYNNASTPFRPTPNTPSEIIVTTLSGFKASFELEE
ncbi:hypothetical protein BU24DRAFT_473352 [Aaosphaeria arxii CBS 175.79]|uniref:Uncharacterized protein n=1 Tax=Aaosphaeria arxii CBS 175.79 TaxID=1450172 RepID=A0A6A5XB75_9PLEO|nr:uncharacterized protein BU24DRAFT_473352 [Aaosphaeria arxii CBS 175.79]KAF2010170.1 hypothetical protein BU24DRAFT_473352 [Aaosphaeria arxii CBS 175.79]